MRTVTEHRKNTHTHTHVSLCAKSSPLLLAHFRCFKITSSYQILFIFNKLFIDTYAKANTPNFQSFDPVFFFLFSLKQVYSEKMHPSSTVNIHLFIHTFINLLPVILGITKMCVNEQHIRIKPT